MIKGKLRLVLTTFIFLIGTEAYSSDSTNVILKRNIAFITFGGQENFGSINYEHIFSSGKKLIWSYSIGVQPFELSKKFSLPVSINAFTKGSLHHLEVDLTGTFFMNKFHPYDGGWKEDFNKQLYVSPFICYRLQKRRGIVIKTGVGPQILFDPPSNNILQFRTTFLSPSIFASLGISF